MQTKRLFIIQRGCLQYKQRGGLQYKEVVYNTNKDIIRVL